MGALPTRFAFALAGIAPFLAGCAVVPPERVERDRVILAAVQPCKERYAERLYNPNMMSVRPNGRVRYWYKGDQVAASYEIDQCLSEATKGLRLGPWLPGRLAKPGPANVTISMAGKDVVVPVRVNGILGTMAVRGGVDFTSITSAYAKRAGLLVVAESPTVRVRAGGKSIFVPYSRARAVELGDVQVEALDVAVHTVIADHPTVDGVLGKSFLGNFKMTIDRGAGRLTLEPNPMPGGGRSL